MARASGYEWPGPHQSSRTTERGHPATNRTHAISQSLRVLLQHRAAHVKHNLKPPHSCQLLDDSTPPGLGRRIVRRVVRHRAARRSERLNVEKAANTCICRQRGAEIAGARRSTRNNSFIMQYALY